MTIELCCHFLDTVSLVPCIGNATPESSLTEGKQAATVTVLTTCWPPLHQSLLLSTIPLTWYYSLFALALKGGTSGRREPRPDIIDSIIVSKLMVTLNCSKTTLVALYT